jgi:hypothetical protein
MKCVWIALVAAPMVFGSDFALQDYLPPDTKVVMGLRVHALTESSLFQETGASAKTLTESWTKLTAVTGFDPLRDIDEVLLTSPADRENAPALVVLRGRFNLDRLSAGAELYHGVAIQGGGKKGSGVLALLDATTALAGEAPVVKAAIDRRGQPVAYDGAMVTRVASLRERFDLWGTGERPQGFVAPGGQNEQPGSQWLQSIDRFEFGIRITHGLELGAEVHARSQKDAEKLAASLAMFQMMAKAQSNAAKFDVTLEGSTLKLSFAVSEEELKKTIAAQRSAAAPKPVSSQPKVTGETPAPGPAVRQSTTPAGTSVFTLPGKR